MKTLLSIDLSTSSTGWALFDVTTKKLLEYGVLKARTPSKSSKWIQHKKALYAMNYMAEDVLNLVLKFSPSQIVIEQINRGLSRIGQKTLDGVHWMVLESLRKNSEDWIDKVSYFDTIAWRQMLGLKLSEQDKQVNAEIRKQNQRKKKSTKAPVIDWKVLAQRFVNIEYQMVFNVWEVTGDNDIVDAIALGTAFLRFLDTKPKT